MHQGTPEKHHTSDSSRIITEAAQSLNSTIFFGHMDLENKIASEKIMT